MQHRLKEMMRMQHHLKELMMLMRMQYHLLELMKLMDNAMTSAAAKDEKKANG